MNGRRGVEPLPLLAAYAAALAGVGLVSLATWLARASLSLAPIALVHLLAVFCAALIWGMGPAIASSILAFVALDYLFVPPFFSLTIAAPSEVTSLLVFLAVAIVTSRLAAWARVRARDAEARARESNVLLRLSDATADAASTDDVLHVIAELARELFHVPDCAILLPDCIGVLGVRAAAPAGVHAGLTREEDGVVAFVWRDRVIIPYGGALYLPLRLRAEPIGVLRMRMPAAAQPLAPAEQGLLRAFAAAAAAAIDRRGLQDAATHAEVLRRSDELKTALLGSVSHDLRTPLATLKTGITALLHSEVPWDREAQQELLVAANEEVDRLTRLINNLLDLTRIEAGALTPDRQWYEAGELISDGVRRAANRIRDHRIVVDVADGDRPVFLDYVEIQQVLTNLLDNAAKYAPAGTDIYVSGGAEGDAFVMRVRDRGPGIPVSEADRIFSKFFRVAGRPTGTGLGLAICRGLVEAHGGRIVVENPGQTGAVFAVSLPLATPPALAGSSA